MGDNLKILFSTMGFMSTGDPMKLIGKPCARYFSEFGDFSHFSAVLTDFHYISTVLSHEIKNGAYLTVFWSYSNVII